MFRVLGEHNNYSAMELYDIRKSSSNSLIDLMDGLFTTDKLSDRQIEDYPKFLTHLPIRAYKFRHKSNGTNIVLYMKKRRVQFKAKELLTLASLLEHKRTFVSKVNRQILLELAEQPEVENVYSS